MANPGHPNFQQGRVDMGHLAGHTEPARHPEAIVEVPWIPDGDQSEVAELSRNQAARLDGTRAYATTTNEHAGVRQDFVGIAMAGGEGFPIIAISNGVSDVRDFVLARINQQGGATPIARIPRHGHGRPLEIGREPSTHTGHLPSLSDQLSRRHARVYVESGNPLVVDSSTNGTSVHQPSAARAAKQTHKQTPFGPTDKWAIEDNVAKNFRPAYPPAISESGPQRIGIAERVFFDGTQPMQYTARIRDNQPPLETQAMGAETYGLDGKQIAVVEVAPGERLGEHAEALYVYDRGTKPFDGKPPKPFQPGGKPLKGDQRFVVVTEQFLIDAEAARASGDYSAMRNHPGMVVLDRNSTKVSVSRDFWRITFGHEPRQKERIAPEHAEIQVTRVADDMGDIAEVRVIDKGSGTGTRLTVPRPGSEHVIPSPDTGMTQRIGSAATGHTIPYPSR